MANKAKKEVFVVGYPPRVKGVADLLEMEGTGISPVQVGVLGGNQEFFARLRLHGSPDAIILFAGAFKGVLIPTIEQAHNIAPTALILVVLLEVHSREDSLKKAGATVVFQRAGNIDHYEVVEQLVEMFERHGGSAMASPVLRVPNVKPTTVSVPRVKPPKPVRVPRLKKPVKVAVPRIKPPKPAKVPRVKKPVAEATQAPIQTFIVSEEWLAMIRHAVGTARTAPPPVSHGLVSQVHIVPAKDSVGGAKSVVATEKAREGPAFPQASPPGGQELVIDDRMFNRRRRVIFHGRTLHLSEQLSGLLRLLHENKEDGVGMKEFYQMSIFDRTSAAVAVSNLRRQLVKANRQWRDALTCVDGRYYLKLKTPPS